MRTSGLPLQESPVSGEGGGKMGKGENGGGRGGRRGGGRRKTEGKGEEGEEGGVGKGRGGGGGKNYHKTNTQLPRVSALGEESM